jgi:hypothetical protein
MIPVIKEHPFRIISLNYQGIKAVSDFELEALDNYYKLHDQTYAFKQLLLKELADYTTYAEQLAESAVLMENLKREYLLVQPILDYIRGTVDLTKATGEPVMFDTAAMMTALHAFQSQFLPIHDQLKNAEQEDAIHDQMQEKTEQGIIAWDNTYFSPIIQDWENMEIDIVSFDEDFNNYREAYEEIDLLNDKVYEIQEKVFQRYNEISDGWKPLHGDLTQLLTELHNYDNRPDPGMN